jgi:hypothetical protein
LFSTAAIKTATFLFNIAAAPNLTRRSGRTAALPYPARE